MTDETSGIIAIVGRPNVGKSTLFNRLVGRRQAIVQREPGVTRDRIFGRLEWRNHPFLLIDTGGFLTDEDPGMPSSIQVQTRLAMQEADVVLLLVDARAGVMPLDRELAATLIRLGCRVLLVTNKVDDPKVDPAVYEFHELGLGEPLPISAEHALGIDDMLDAIVILLGLPDRAFSPDGPELAEESTDDEQDEKLVPAGPVRIAVVGRPNVGKSSLINSLVGKERTVVDAKPGTTRDAIDSEVEHAGRRFVLVDTAGIRRMGKIRESVEHYSVLRAIKAIERCDVAALICDASEGITDGDARIGRIAVRAGRGILIVCNKWDQVTAELKEPGPWVRQARNRLPFLNFAELQFVSALTGQRTRKILDASAEIAARADTRIPTPKLNRLLELAFERHAPRHDQGRPLKLLYASQVFTRPPTFVLVVNHPKAWHFSYERYLINRLREEYDFRGVPIRIKVAVAAAGGANRAGGRSEWGTLTAEARSVRLPIPATLRSSASTR